MEVKASSTYRADHFSGLRFLKDKHGVPDEPPRREGLPAQHRRQPPTMR